MREWGNQDVYQVHLGYTIEFVYFAIPCGIRSVAVIASLMIVWIIMVGVGVAVLAVMLVAVAKIPVWTAAIINAVVALEVLGLGLPQRLLTR